VVIEKNVPLPPRKSGKHTRTAEKMELHDSVLLDTENEAATLTASLRRLGRKGVQRKVSGGWRVWRAK
jgi:hypothetical protein